MSKLPRGLEIPQYAPGIVVSADRYRSGARGVGVSLCPELVSEARRGASIGMKRPFLAKRLGVTEATFRLWLAQGKREAVALEAWIEAGAEGDQPRASMRWALLREIEKGESDFVASLTGFIVDSEDAGTKLRLLKAAAPKHYTEHASAYIDDESGEETKSGADVLAALMGKLAPLADALDQGGGGDG